MTRRFCRPTERNHFRFDPRISAAQRKKNWAFIIDNLFTPTRLTLDSVRGSEETTQRLRHALRSDHPREDGEC